MVHKLVIGLNTKDANDASGHRTSAIWDYLVDSGSANLYVIEKKLTERNNFITYSRLGFLYNSLKSWYVLRVFFELILALEFILFQRKLLNRSDWIWISSPPFFFSLTIIYLLRNKNKKIIFDVKDLYPEVFIMTDIINRKNWIYRRLEKFTHAQLRKVIIVGATAGISKYYENVYEDRTILTLLNGSNLTARPMRKNFTKPFTIVFHGRLGKLQNVVLLKSLIKELPLIQFYILSKDRLFRDGARPPNVIELGLKSSPDLIEIIKNSHLGLSLRDNSQLSQISNAVKVFDYIACGTPVISSPISEIDQHTKELGLLMSFEYEAADTIKQFISDISTNESKYYAIFPNAGIPCNKFVRSNIVKSFFQEMDKLDHE